MRPCWFCAGDSCPAGGRGFRVWPTLQAHETTSKNAAQKDRLEEIRCMTLTLKTLRRKDPACNYEVGEQVMVVTIRWPAGELKNHASSHCICVRRSQTSRIVTFFLLLAERFLRQFPMRCLIPFVLLTTTVWAQSPLRVQVSHTTEGLRGVSAVSREIAWASGTHGTYLRTTDGGRTWTPGQVPDAGALDFRAVVCFLGRRSIL